MGIFLSFENFYISIICRLLVVLFVYVNTQELKKNTSLGTFRLLLLSKLISVIYLILVPFLLIILCTLVIFREFLGVILKIKHGSKFGGFLHGSDPMHMTKGTPDHIINALFMCRCTKSMPAEDFYRNIKNVIRKAQKYTKFNSKFYTLCNYSYMLKEQLQVDDCIREFRVIEERKDKISKSKFLPLFDEYCNLNLPKENTVPWEVIVGKQKVVWRDDEYDYYPVLLRAGHAVFDGATLLEVLVKILSNTENTKTKFKLEATNRVVWTKKLAKALTGFLRLFVLYPAYFISTFIIKAKDDNILRSSKLSGQVYRSISIEDRPGYVQKIKQIKNAIPGFSFPDVILTALSASLNDYLLKNSNKIEYISTAIPCLSSSVQIPYITPEGLHITDSYIKNKLSLVIVNTPIYIKSESTTSSTIIKRLQLIRKQSLIIRHSSEKQMFDLSLNIVCPYLPLKVCEWIMKPLKVTTLLSILPGPPKICCWGKSVEISDIVGFTPLGFDYGISLLTNTYDGRLQIGMNVDKTLMSCQEDVQEILDNTLKHIDEYYKHIDLLKTLEWDE